MGKLYRPKTFIMYYYGLFNRCYICCYPQQRWELIETYSEKVELRNKSKHITIEIDHDNFNENWILVNKE